ncbi:MAG TPA: hypothetical protein PLL06_04790 [Acidobacteriota bacterium]|nr:hypothetical protein [Acidobacteriota bacterium]
MKSKLQAVFLLCLLGISLLVLPPQPVRACGPDFGTARFIFTKHPDFPLRRFARGELNVLQPAYAWSYLIVAYRYLNGIGLDEIEQEAVIAKWETRLGISQEKKSDYWLNQWLDARKAVSNAPASPKISEFVKEGDSYSAEIAITAEAFQVAIRTLNDRIKQFGPTSPQVREWLKAQDQVFQTASGEPSIPEAPAASLDTVIKADRAYQIAAANFYANEHELAVKGFDEIAKDGKSPWKTMAPYLAIRTLNRKFEKQIQTTPEEQAKLFGDIRDRSAKVLADKQLSEYHAATRRLLADVQLAEIAAKSGSTESGAPTPEQTQAEVAVLEPITLDLARDLMRPHSGSNIGRNLWNFPNRLDEIIEKTTESGSFWDTVDFDRVNRKFKTLPAIRQKDDLIDWILVFQTMDDEARDYAIQTWEKTGKLHWLCAALTKATGDSPKLANLISAAERVPADSPASTLTTYHRLRLLVETGKLDDARKGLAEFIKTKGNRLTQSSVNLFSQLQMHTATNLTELAKNLSRHPAGITNSFDYFQLPADFLEVYPDWPESEQIKKERQEEETQFLFDVQAARVLNQGLPLSQLGALLQDTALPKNLRGNLALAVWVKAGLLENRDVATQASLVVDKLVPELKDMTSAYRAANTAPEAKFALIFAVLRFPGLRPHIVNGLERTETLDTIDSYRDNWWCNFDGKLEVSSGNFEKFNYYDPDQEYGPDGEPIPKPEQPFDPAKVFFPPAFLTAEQKEAAFKEWKTLVAIGTAPNYLCRQTIDWAKKNPTDARVPEALHLAVRTTRFGCTNDTTTNLSKEAFQLLKKKYPTDPWAQKTKYHY